MSDFPPDSEEYSAGSIKVLYFPEAIRARPQIYVGDVRDGSGLHYLIEAAVEDALVRQPTRVTVGLREDATVVVTDDGLPFPFAGEFAGSPHYIEADPGVPGSIAALVESALTGLMTHGAGWALPTVNGLSSRFDARLWRDGDEYVIGFEEGLIVAPLVRVGLAPSISGMPCQGAEISFIASTGIFGSIAYDQAVIQRHLQDLGKQHTDVRFALQ